MKTLATSLNPYSNGRYSERMKKEEYSSLIEVLILILMEDTLRVVTRLTFVTKEKRLNPYSNGRYSESNLTINNYEHFQ